MGIWKLLFKKAAVFQEENTEENIGCHQVILLLLFRTAGSEYATIVSSNPTEAPFCSPKTGLSV
jgi:hypothetical protein